MHVPLLDLKRQYESIGVASGTDAIWLALRACGVGTGDAVLTTPFTFFATASAILNTGARPVFVDIEPQTFNVDPDKLRQRFESDVDLQARAKAIVPVHLYGQMANMRPIRELASEHGLSVIEDAAQAIGAQAQGELAGSSGNLGCFSFFPTKNLGAFGDAGLVTTTSDELAEKVRLLRVHGSATKYHHELVGSNSRLDALQAAILRVKLRHLPSWIEARQQCASDYDAQLGGLESLTIPQKSPDHSHVYHQYTVRVHDGGRDALRAHLERRGIGTAVYYPQPLHLQPALADAGYREGDYPEAERASREVLSLPMFPELTSREQEAVATAIAEFGEGKS
ncbi:MAG: DegT/DnrJ/EryC1/StrS family aminotransferase [Salinibacter sp.]